MSSPPVAKNSAPVGSATRDLGDANLLFFGRAQESERQALAMSS